MTAIKPIKVVSTSIIPNYTPGTGYALQPNTQQAALPPPLVANPPLLIGVDYVTQTIQSGLTTITFPNLPIRGQNNPTATLQNQPKTIIIPQGDLLIFEVSTNTGIPVTPRILNTSNTPFNANSVSTGTYKTFQAIVDAGTMVNITVFAKLYLCQGNAT